MNNRFSDFELDFNTFIGAKLKRQRILMGCSQTDIGKVLNVSFQQVQKYEQGKNRINISKLLLLSKFFGVKISYFFKGLDLSKKNEIKLADSAQKGQTSLDSMDLDMLKFYRKIKDPKMKKQILSICKKIIKI